MSHNRNLYFAVNINANTKLPIVSVEGAGVNASIRTPNIVAENGIIHIIDRIMDIPSQTVYEKLKSNPTIRFVFHTIMHFSLILSKQIVTIFNGMLLVWIYVAS